MTTGESARGLRRSGRIFFGWWIIAASMVFQALGQGLFQQPYGAYVVLLQNEFGWSKTSFSLAFAVQPAQSAVLGPIHGWMLDRFGPRLVIQIGIVFFGLGFILFSQIHSLTAFYLTFFVLAIGSNLAGFLSLTVSVVNWFERKRSTAMGMVNLGLGIGGLSLPIVTWALTRYGWRDVAFASGILIIVVGLPLSSLMRHRPEDYGLLPDGARPEPNDPLAGPVSVAPAELSGFTLKEAMRTRAFWLISLGHGAALLVVAAVQVHLILQLTQELSFSLEGAAGVVTLVTASMMVGNVIGGALGDRYDKRIMTGLAMFGHASALLVLAWADSLLPVIYFGVAHGMAWGVRGVLMQTIRVDYFGRKDFGKIMGVSNSIVMAGNIGGPVFAGLMADHLGNYRLGFTVLAFLAGLGSLFFFMAKRPDPPQRMAQPTEPAVVPQPARG